MSATMKSSIPIPSFRSLTDFKVEESITISDETPHTMNQTFEHKKDQVVMTIPSTVSSILKSMSSYQKDGSHYKAYYFSDYVKLHAPEISLPSRLLSDHCPEEDNTYNIMRKIIIILFDDDVPTYHRGKSHSVSEPLDSLVDGVIYSLVHRRNRLKNNPIKSYHPTTKNVLSLGYELAKCFSSQFQSSHSNYHNASFCHNMPPGVKCTHPNTSASFIKSSQVTQKIHALLGDDLMRDLLLHTILLLPCDSNQHKPNYIQLCGPPLAFYTRNNPSQPPSPTANNDKSSFDANAPLPRHLLLYSNSFVKKIGLPPSHVLNQSLSPEANRNLLHSIFTPNQQSDRTKMKRNLWNRLRNNGIRMCILLRQRHQKTDYARIFNRICPLPNKTNHDDDDGLDLTELITLHTPSSHVVLFLSTILRSAFPFPTFWGSHYNFQTFLQTLETFVNLRNNETLTIKLILQNIRVNDFTWISSSSSSSSKCSKDDFITKTKLVTQILKWVYCQYIIPLLRCLFYITDTEFGGNQMAYYRKPIWQRIRSKAMTSWIKKGRYNELTKSDAHTMLRHMKLGCAKLRFLPKKNAVRPIAVLSKREFVDIQEEDEQDHTNRRPNKKIKLETSPKSSSSSFAKRKNVRYLSTNMILNDAFQVLKYEHAQSPHKFGAGIFGLHEVFPLLLNFLQDLKWFRKQQQQQHHHDGTTNNSSATTTQPPILPLYFASADIHHCYDTIQQNHVYNLLQSLLTEDDYLLQKYSVIHPYQSKANKVQHQTIQTVGPPEDFVPFFTVAQQRLSQNYSNSIFADGVNCSIVKKGPILDLCQEHLFHHMLVTEGDFGRKRFMMQTNGIPQGSVLSTLLCNLYYGDVEKELLEGVFCDDDDDDEQQQQKHVHLLLRIVDDFLLITTHRETSIRFLKKMQKGIPQLGVQINKTKTRVNFDVTLPIEEDDDDDQQLAPIVMEPVTKSVIPFEKSHFFQWCGMLFDTITCEVRVDTSRFDGTQTWDSFTVKRKKGKEGAQLQTRMKTFVRPRCMPILYDERINRKKGIIINFYQTILLCAIKTVYYVKCALNDDVEKNPKFVLNCIEDLICYAYHLIVARLKKKKKNGCMVSESEEETMKANRCGSCFCLSKENAQWLGRHAFRAVLCKKRKVYGDVIQQLSIKVPKKKKHFLEKGMRSSSGVDLFMLIDISSKALRQFDLNRFVFP